MVALDGNAIGGLLLEVFGTDMTDAEATCATPRRQHRLCRRQRYGSPRGRGRKSNA